MNSVLIDEIIIKFFRRQYCYIQPYNISSKLLRYEGTKKCGECFIFQEQISYTRTRYTEYQVLYLILLPNSVFFNFLIFSHRQKYQNVDSDEVECMKHLKLKLNKYKLK